MYPNFNIAMLNLVNIPTCRIVLIIYLINFTLNNNIINQQLKGENLKCLPQLFYNVISSF